MISPQLNPRGRTTGLHPVILCPSFHQPFSHSVRLSVRPAHVCLENMSKALEGFAMRLHALLEAIRAPDKMRKINFNRRYLCFFFTKSYVWPLVTIFSTRQFLQVNKH